MKAATIRQIGFGIALLGSISIGCARSPHPAPWPEPGPLAHEIPAFQAPAEQPEELSELSVPEAESPAAAITLDDALSLALMRNPQLATFAWDVRAADARALQARAFPNPQLNVRIDHVGDAFEEQGSRALRGRAILAEDIELGCKRLRRMDHARAERDLADAEYEATRNEIVALTTSRFVKVLGAQREVACLDSSVAALEHAHEMARERLSRGVIAEIEMNETVRVLGLTKIELRHAEEKLSAAREELAALWNGTQPRFARAEGDLGTLPQVLDRDSLLALADTGPEARRAAAEIEARRAAVALARADRWPDVGAGVGLRGDREIVGAEILFDFDIPLPFVDRKQGDIEEAQSELAKSTVQAQEAQADTRAEVARAFNDLAAGRAEAEILEREILPAVRSSRAAMVRAFPEDGADLKDLTGAERDLSRAEVQLIDAQVMFHQALATIEWLVGQPIVISAE